MAFLDTIERLFNALRNNSPRAWRSSWAWENNDTFLTFNSFTPSALKTKTPKDTRIEMKPKDVMKELFGKMPNIDFSNLDQKIKLIKHRRDFIKDELERPAPEEEQALIWLEARKRGVKYLKEFTWKVTNEEKLTVLLKKYKLAKAPLDSYHLAVPEEAIIEMEKYYTLWKKIVPNKKEKPEFVIIADIPKEQKTYRRNNDPILLVTSPFAQFYFILGAWDKHVQILHELFVKNR